jgi:hypothetical protein
MKIIFFGVAAHAQVAETIRMYAASLRVRRFLDMASSLRELLDCSFRWIPAETAVDSRRRSI